MAQNWVEDFVKKAMYNKTSTMEYFDSCKQTREYQMMPEVRKIINTYFASFCFNNGLWNRIIKEQLIEYLNDTQQTFLFMVLKLKNIPKDRYNQHIMEWYFKNYDSLIENISINQEAIDLKTKSGKSFIMAYYNQSPAIFEKIKEVKEMIEVPKLKDDELVFSNELIKNIPLFIKMGKSLQFDVKGFVKNQLLYMLYGLTLYYVEEKFYKDFKIKPGKELWEKYLKLNETVGQKPIMNEEDLKREESNEYSKIHSLCHKVYSFKELINTIKKFVQFNLDTKCYNVLDVEEETPKNKDNYYNLITFLILGTKGNEKQYNYRYKCAEKYFDLKDSDSVSYCGSEGKGNITEYKKFKDDGPNAEATSYKTAITTEYSTKEDVEKKWEELEYEYRINGLSEELIIKWFDSQLLTRSTCLIGCMLIALKEWDENNKYIKFKKNEMPDWKAIGLGTYEDTYSLSDEDVEEYKGPELWKIKVKHVLLLLEEYVKNCEKYK